MITILSETEPGYTTVERLVLSTEIYP